MRIRRPYFATLDDIQITREGERAVIVYRDSSIPPVQLWLGPDIAEMSDEEILHQHNSIILSQGLPPEEWMVAEIPPGRPQIDYDARYGQWVTRGETLRCRLADAPTTGEPVILIDGQQLSLQEFGQLLATHAGWGMRIAFVPEDALLETPQRMLWEPPSTGAPRAPEKQSSPPEPSGPCIADALAEFMRDVQRRFSCATVSRYQKIVEQLRDHLDYCGPFHLTPQQEQLLHGDDGSAARSFCRAFGPDQIFPELEGFLGAYAAEILPLSRTVRRSLPAACKRLFNWLAKCEYIDEMARRRAVRDIESAADRVRRAEKAGELLRRDCRIRHSEPDLRLQAHHYRVVQVERTTLQLADPLGLDGSAITVSIPPEVGRLMEEDWIVACRLGRDGDRWRIICMGAVHPR